MNPTIETAPRSESQWPGILAAIVLPLAVAATACALWWISDRLLYVGPLDRAAFGWVVVIPTWIAAPLVAGLVWRRLDPGTTRAAAVAIAVLVASVAAVLLWQAIAFPACEFGSVHTPQEMIPPSLLFGAVVGGGFALSGLVATGFARRGRPVAALVVGAGTELLMVAAALLVVGATLVGPFCQRPTV